MERAQSCTSPYGVNKMYNILWLVLVSCLVFYAVARWFRVLSESACRTQTVSSDCAEDVMGFCVFGGDIKINAISRGFERHHVDRCRDGTSEEARS